MEYLTYCESKFKEVEDNKYILFYIQKNTNKNIVVYEAKINEGEFKEIDIYWMCIDPEHIKKRRKKGLKEDRCDMGIVETRLAFGLNEHNGKLKLVSVKDREMEKVIEKCGTPRLKTIINKKECYIESVYAHIEGKWLGLPRVKYVIISGIDIVTKDRVVEKVVTGK